MKKTAFLVCLVLTFFSQSALQAATSTTVTSEIAAENLEVTQLVHRLEEIKATDKTEMSRDEKKALRQEVRSIKKELREIGGGVYLSVGAIIIIVLLLILLL